MTDLQECAGCPKLGACCYFSAPVQFADSIAYVASRIPCPYLNTDTKLCTRYETRLEVPWCSPVGGPNIIWPGFCPHVDPWRGVVLHENDLQGAGADQAEIKQVLDGVDKMVIKRALVDYGVELSAPPATPDNDIAQ